MTNIPTANAVLRAVMDLPDIPSGGRHNSYQHGFTRGHNWALAVVRQRILDALGISDTPEGSDLRETLPSGDSTDDFDVTADCRAERTADAQTYHEGEK